MPTVLNLSNEVVKMRSEVKKVKVFIIRKLTRQMTMLKKKKGKEEDVQRNQRRAARLLEEIHEIKVLAPDIITKSALQKDINFEKVCQNAEASITDRAVARIATHPQFSQMIQSIKDRINAFKEERISSMSKKEKKTKSDITDKEAEEPQDTASEAKEVTEKQDGNDNLPSESGVTVTYETTAPQTNSDNEATAVQTSAESEKVPLEVVRMRKEVKKIRVLIISKLTNQIEVLKRKKSEPPEVEDNQQKIAVLLKQIQMLRSIKPDNVTTSALQENANLEKVCEDPDASPLDRATARVATHPRFVKKLQAVRDAIEEEKRKAAEAEEKKKMREQASLRGEDSDNEEKEVQEGEEEEEEEEEDDSGEEEEDEEDDDEEDEEEDDDDDEEEDEEEEEVETGDSEAESEEEEEEEEEKLNEIHISSKSQVAEVAHNVSDEEISIKATTAPVKKQVTVKFRPEGHSVTVVNQESTLNISSTVDSSIKSDVNVKPLKKFLTASPAPKNKPVPKPTNKTLVNTGKEKQKVTEAADSESDLDSSDDEEKPYFDDSTEERFHKQSSMSEESDDDFFIGKVSKFKKKKTQATGDEKTKDAKKDVVQGIEQDYKQEEKETTNKPLKFESVFCNALSKRGGASQRPRDRFGAKPPPQFQKSTRQPERDTQGSWEKRHNKNMPSSNKPGSSFHNQKRDSGNNWARKEKGPFGAGNGRQPFDHRQNQSRSQRPLPGQNFKSSQASEVLHPSWEASKKRKEQTSQIAAFQGKKIKFDDDD